MTQPNPLLIGPSLRIHNSLYEVMANNPYFTCQVTIGNRHISSADRTAVMALCQETGQRLYIHTHLNSNLAKEDANSTIRGLKKDLSIIRGIPGAAVLHVGNACDYSIGKKLSCVERNTALEAIINRLNTLMPYYKTPDRPILLLENAAGEGRDLGDTWEDFRRIAEGLDNNYLGMCLDTQHAFAAGVTDWATFEETNRLLDEAAAVGFPIELIHLNDSKVPFGSRVDRHESIGRGYIWSENQESLLELLARCAEESRGIVLETPSLTQQDDLDYIYANFVVD